MRANDFDIARKYEMVLPIAFETQPFLIVDHRFFKDGIVARGRKHLAGIERKFALADGRRLAAEDRHRVWPRIGNLRTRRQRAPDRGGGPARRRLVVGVDTGDIDRRLEIGQQEEELAFFQIELVGDKKPIRLRRTAVELAAQLAEFFADSDLVVAQEFLPTTFDWRIGVLDKKPLYACKYFMAQGHWQIIRQECDGRGRYGRSETLPVELAPKQAVRVALAAANLIGDGLYGVDVKESDGKFYVIEVNDNPNLDAGFEDAILKDELYRRIMQVFLERIERRKSRFD